MWRMKDPREKWGKSKQCHHVLVIIFETLVPLQVLSYVVETQHYILHVRFLIPICIPKLKWKPQLVNEIGLSMVLIVTEGGPKKAMVTNSLREHLENCIK